jgi:hypothetical protein
MQPLRLLAASLLASACVLPAAAQSPRPLPSPDVVASASPLVTSQSFSPSPSMPLTLKLTNPGPGPSQFNLSQKDGNALILPAETQPLGVQVRPEELAQLNLSKARNSLLLAQTNQPCAKLRSYNFTTQDLKSAHPHPSSETECTPASSAHLKTIPATANTK